MAYDSYYTNKIIKTTKAQYDALKNGESVKGYKLNEKDTFVLDIDSLYNDIPTKTSQLTIDNAIPLVAGKNVSVTPNSNNELVISADGSVKTVNNQEPDNNGNVSITLDNINDGSTRKLANYLPLSGGNMTGNLEFASISYSNAPVSSKGLTWRGGTDAAEIFYRLDANDAGRLVFKTHDDDNCNFVWENSVQGQWMNLSKDGKLAVKGDITSNGNKVALDKDVVKLTGDQSISGNKSFTFLSAKYLNGGIINTHPEASGAPAILGYYTNDLVNLHQRGGSCFIKNLTTNAIISESTPYNLFDASPTYYAFSAAQTDVVEIIIKSPVVYNWVTRGGIGFGNTQWGAKDIKIEVGYSPTGTGTAKNTDTDIMWVTKFNATGNWNEMIFTDITGPDKANGGTNSNSWNYLKFTLTNFRHATIHRIAQIFTFNSGSSGLLQTFLPSAGGTLFGGITPYKTNAYYLGNSDKKWAKLYSNDIYGGYIKSDQYVEGVLRSNSGGRIANANDVPHYNNDNNAANGKAALRLDLATSAMTGNRPSSNSEGSGFIYTNMWDTGQYDTQLYFPWGPKVGTIRPSLRGCNNGTWQTSWTELAYYKDLDNYVPKVNKLADNVDLDTVTTTGFYRLMAISTIINGINVSYSQMIVSQAGGDTIAQLIFPYTESKILFRTGNPINPNNSNGRWHDWKTVSIDGHTHDDRYYTETEVNSKLDGKSNTGHTHQALKILCSINGANTNTYKYRRIISTPVMTGNYTDMSGTYYLYGRYHNAPWYIFKVEVRTNNSSTGVLASAGIQVIATNRDPADLLGGLYTVATNGKTTTYLDVYYKSPFSYVRTQLAYLGVEPFGGWTYYNSNEDSNSTNPVNAYKTLEGNTSDAASFGARGIEKYTQIVYGSLAAKVKNSNYLLSPANTRLGNANLTQVNEGISGQGSLRLDLATSTMTANQPSGPGYIQTYMWDNSTEAMSQLFIPAGDYLVKGYRPSLRGCDHGTWQTSWKELAYYSDIPTALKNPNALKFGSKNYDGSSAQEITLADLGGQTAGNYVTTDTPQTITSVKSFSSVVSFSSGNNNIQLTSTGFVPQNTSGTYSLGSKTYPWTNIYATQFNVAGKASMQYNSTEDCIEFIFA